MVPLARTYASVGDTQTNYCEMFAEAVCIYNGIYAVKFVSLLTHNQNKIYYSQFLCFVFPIQVHLQDRANLKHLDRGEEAILLERETLLNHRALPAY